VALRVRVCRLVDVADLEGDRMRGFAVGGVTWPVIVARLDGELIAFPGVCPHDDVSLVDYGVIEPSEDGTRRDLRCRVHGYSFDLVTGRCEHSPGLHLRRYRVSIIANELWVDLL
jgi:nitrite reductase/ring-hydroxylating ferredoxin subunit